MLSQREPNPILAIVNSTPFHLGLLAGGVVVGARNAGLVGGITGFVTVFLASVGLRNLELGMPRAPLWTHVATRVGGITMVILCFVGGTALGWDWGWLGAVGGFMLSVGFTKFLVVMGQRRREKSPEYQASMEALERAVRRSNPPDHTV